MTTARPDEPRTDATPPPAAQAPEKGVEWFTARELTRAANNLARRLRAAAEDIERHAAKIQQIGTGYVPVGPYSRIAADITHTAHEALASGPLTQIIGAAGVADTHRATRLAGGQD